MRKTPKSLRLHIGLFGRTNVGKSSFLNMISAQDVAITSSLPGTTTDVVEKTMEFLPLGPVVFLDTGGLDDSSALSKLRIKKTKKIFDTSDIFVLIIESNVWGQYEDFVLNESVQRKLPCIVVINKIDIVYPGDDFIQAIQEKIKNIVLCSSIDKMNRDSYMEALKKELIDVCPEDFFRPLPLVADLLPAGGTAVLMIPIDLEAPKGRLILPQVQVLRDILDNDAAAVVVKEREYRHILDNLKKLPDICICDSQVVLKMVADTPKDVKCTTFSIVFSRYKGDLIEMVRGVAAIERLKTGDKVLIAEACSHHPIGEDIGRVKIPRWLRQYTGMDLVIDVCSGHDYPENLKDYKLIIHCGGCMITRRQMLFRIQHAKKAGVSITNYGICISFLQGVLERVLSPFPAASDVYKREILEVRRSLKNDYGVE